METKEFMEYLSSTCWSKKWIEKEEDKDWEDFELERSYADFIYDELTVYKNEKSVRVSYNDIGWGYTNYESCSFTYEEFIAWNESYYYN